ncbi:MAG: hypothetical protein GX633_02825 [Clostridiales bacterium]|nr:hypothetical protein [Clostridiales bacterium]
MNTLRAGFSVVDITPPLNAPVVGSWTDRKIDGYKGPLSANTVVLEKNRERIAIISAELCEPETSLSNFVREEVERRFNIPKKNVFVAATHVHSGPKVTNDPNDHYSQNLRMQLVTGVMKALADMEDVRIGIGKSESTLFTHNRRLRAANGEIAMNWFDPKLLQDCTENEEERDPDIFSIRFERPDRSIKGFIINYSNHNNAMGGTYVNGDIGAYIGERLRDLYGKNCVTLLLLGACGDVNWCDFKDIDWPRDSFHYRRIAEHILGHLLIIGSNLEYPEIDSISAECETEKMLEREFNEYDSVIDRTFNYKPQGGLEVVQAKMKKEPLREHDVNTGIIRLGNDIVILTVNAEYFSAFALDIKKASQYKYTIISQLTNGCVNYVPTREAYKQGGYEVRKPATLLDYGAGEVICEKLKKLL